jgi:hypothetical protein
MCNTLNERAELMASLADMRQSRTIEALKDMVERIDAAGLDPVKLGAVYADVIGYDAHKEDPDTDPAEMRDTLRDYVLEVGYGEGVHCSEYVPIEWAHNAD